MKKERILAAVAAGTLALSIALTGCGEGTTTTNNNGKTNTQQNTTQSDSTFKTIEFVAADKTNWDKEITIGEYAYTLHLDLKEGGVVELNATCTGKPQAATGNGGSGSGGEEDTADTAEPEAEMTDAEKAAQNFTLSGSWVKEDGYGYTITIDGYTTKTDYEDTSARHYFYAEIKNSGLVQFQGKDTGFLKEIASGYKTFEERDAELTFKGSGTTATGNASSTSLWLEKDGSANSLIQSGSSPTYARGTWTKNADGSLTLSIGGSDYVVSYCDVAGKEGYRVNYNSNLMYSNTSATYTDADFDGKTVQTLLCGEGDYTLALTDKGIAVLYNGAERSKDGTYTGSGDSLTVVLGGETYKAENGMLTVSWTSGEGSSASTVERTFATDGSQPEATAAPATENTGTEESSSGETEGQTTETTDAPAEGTEESSSGETEGQTTETTDAPAEGTEESSSGETEGQTTETTDAPAEGTEESSSGDAPAEGGDAPAEGGDAPAEGAEESSSGENEGGSGEANS